MNDSSASPAEAAAPHGATSAPLPSTPIWDAPVRVFHWLMVLSFAGAWLTAESERWRLVHVTLGYTMAALVVFRLVWGLVGTRHSRFGQFVKGPAAVARYLKALLQGQAEHHAGHNPAGALAIVAMLGLTLLTTGAGWALYNEVGGEWLEDWHEAAANLMLAVVGIHVAGVLLASFMHRENLVASMFHGRKQAPASEGIPSARLWVAVLILAGVLGFWVGQWEGAPRPGVDGVTPEGQHAAPADGHTSESDHEHRHSGDKANGKDDD